MDRKKTLIIDKYLSSVPKYTQQRPEIIRQLFSQSPKMLTKIKHFLDICIGVISTHGHPVYRPEQYLLAAKVIMDISIQIS